MGQISSKSSSKIKERKEQRKRKEAKLVKFCPLTNRCPGGFERHRRTSGIQLQPCCKDMITTSLTVTAVIYLIV